MATITANPAKSTTITATVADITGTLSSGPREYRIVTFVDQHGKQRTFAVNEKFYLNNKDRIVADATLVIVYETTQKDVTTWEDAQGKVALHTYSGDNIRSVVRATSQQAKTGLLDMLEERLVSRKDDNPAFVGALATLYGSMLR
jgi:uncharacterized protein involved in tellurium resistance